MKEVTHRKKCTYCRTRFATHPARKVHETMMHREKLIEDGIIVIGKTARGSKYHHISTRGTKWKTTKPMVFSTTPHIGSIETVIEPNKSDGTLCINPTKKYPKGTFDYITIENNKNFDFINKKKIEENYDNMNMEDIMLYITQVSASSR